jgi:hypothetical protein
VGVTRGSETDPVLGPPKIGGEVCWAGRAKSSDAKWAILEKKFGLGQTSSKFAEICSDGIPKSNFFFQPPGYRRPKKTCAGPNSFGLRPTWVSTGSKFVRMPTDLEQTPGQICSDGPTYLPTYFRGSSRPAAWRNRLLAIHAALAWPAPRSPMAN